MTIAGPPNSPRKLARPFGDVAAATVCTPEAAAIVPARFAELVYPLDVHSGYVVPGGALKSLKYTPAPNTGAQRITPSRPRRIDEVYRSRTTAGGLVLIATAASRMPAARGDRWMISSLILARGHDLFQIVFSVWVT